ncbi:protein polybromo-1 isoform X3 [Chrysoperla carnea]|uniref:protein polybromo-1 isoform X3 n=1 Tax=Chrysoperla carnea TaxID=189513 RepID=UPI001D078EF5|nr:protein polybromo-1 isoform X3 [Chrysoperla carnea]
MSKRRRTSSIASRQDDDFLDDVDASTSSGPTVRKRKRQDPSEICQQLYEIIRNFKKEDGALLCDSFIRAPKRRQEPGYYEVVSNPIDLLKIQQKLKTDEYEDPEDLTADVDLMVKNAKAFYKKNSQEFKDACDLWDLFITTKNRLIDEEAESKGKIILKVGKLARRAAAAEARGTPTSSKCGQDIDIPEDTSESSTNPDDELINNQYEDLFTAVMMATDQDNRPLHTVFQLLPSKKKYPEYYEVIENPIDLKIIATKIQQNDYTCLTELERDLLLMTRNACLFNEPGSQIYKDAKALKKVITSKKIEIEHGKFVSTPSTAGKSSERIRNKRLRGVQSLSAVTAALRDEDTDSELGGNDDSSLIGSDMMSLMDEPEIMDIEDPKWQLFAAIRNAVNPHGTPLSEPFWKLPSKRYYPDYYREIKNPVSLSQIRMKLKKGDYGTVSEVAGDMNIMFENAKKYNVHQSKLYKDAVKLQKIMQLKVQELLDIDQVNNISNATHANAKYHATYTNNHKKSLLHNIIKDTESDCESEDSRGVRRGRPPKIRQSTPNPQTTPNSGGNSNKKDNIPLKKRLHNISKFLIDYSCEDGRQPMLLFMEKPSKKLYPDYYQIIQEPIDVITIEANIKNDKYLNEDELVQDFKLMFSNCRQYNEENSMIYNDAILLERVLMDKINREHNINTNLNTSGSNTPGTGERKTATGRIMKPRKILSPNEQKLRSLYDAIRDYREPKSERQLSLIFMKLPSKNVMLQQINQKSKDYPDYYEVIKEPIDMEQISMKLKTSQYGDKLDKLVNDFILMFDNACKYNEPDSQIYKDALILQRVCLQTKQHLYELDLQDDNIHQAPDVQLAVQDLLLTLFTTVYNYQDDEGRCFSDSMAELPEHDEIDGKKVRALSLDLIKRRLDRGVYKRLDQFQDDFFACMDRARKLSHSTSQIFEDAIELQSYFIKQRDEICRNGDLLQSPALNYTLLDLQQAIENTKVEKMEQLQQATDQQSSTTQLHGEMDIENENSSSNLGSSLGVGGTSTIQTPNQKTNFTTPKENIGDSMTCNQRTFRVGEFVYIESKEKGVEPSIIVIERLWTNSEGQQMLYGNYFLRPSETFHVTTRKFLEQEVFKSDAHVAVPLNEVKERCCVLNIKDYIKMKPEGYADKDVYVCESRYSTRARAFKKIKVWPVPDGIVKLVERPAPIEPKRVMSVFRERVEKHKDELAELAEQEATLIEKDKPNVVAFNIQSAQGVSGCIDNVYYEQYNTICSGVVKTGDFVYVATDGGRQLIAQIDTIWETKDGKCYFRGPWLIQPSEVPHLPTRLFYKQEVFLSTIEDTNPLVGIVGKCSVLEYQDYISCRITEIPEQDVYICESIYDEMKRITIKLQHTEHSLKHYQHSSLVTEDETYFFRRLINPQKEPSPILPKIEQDVEMLMEDSLDGGPPSVGSGGGHDINVTPTIGINVGNPGTPGTSTGVLTGVVNTGGIGTSSNTVGVTGTVTNSGVTTSVVSTPVSSKKEKKQGGKKIVTGYILYSSEVRKTVAQNNPDSTFGEISRIVGNEWRTLPTHEKQVWEEKAAKCNEENADQGPTEFVYECLWDDCDYQFEDLSDLLEHCIQDDKGHVQLHFNGVKEPEFQCHWRGCIRIKKSAPSFPHLPRLARHVREVHIIKGNGKLVTQENKSKNYVPSKKSAQIAAANSNNNSNSSTANMNIKPFNNTTNNTNTGTVTQGQQQMVMKPVEPIFITVPPRPTRLLHSEAYIKYIEGLHVSNKFMSPWEKTLNATELNTTSPVVTIPAVTHVNNTGLGGTNTCDVTTTKVQLLSHWLANGERNHSSLTSALWSLRDLMMKDIMSVYKN